MVVGFDQNKAHPYEIENRTGKLTCKIVDKQSGELIAEACIISFINQIWLLASIVGKFLIYVGVTT